MSKAPNKVTIANEPDNSIRPEKPLAIKLTSSAHQHQVVDYINFTQAAEQRILESLIEQDRVLKEENSKSKLLGIRISVKAGTCGAFSYNIEFAYQDINVLPFDDIIQLQNGCNIFVDPNGSFVLFDLKMDYEDDGIEYGFRFDSPQEGGRCKCGTSFYMAEKNQSATSD